MCALSPNKTFSKATKLNLLVADKWEYVLHYNFSLNSFRGGLWGA